MNKLEKLLLNWSDTPFKNKELDLFFKEEIEKMTKKLIALRWIPASGKSMWAREQINARVFNKDLIRESLHKWIYSKENEKQVVEVERGWVEGAMNEWEELIIVDNTHLGKANPHLSFYKELAEANEYLFEIRDFFITRQEAIERDSKREKPVGVDVINKMIKMQGNGGYPHNPEFKEQDTSLPWAYIVDIDWTLAFMDDKRSPYDYSKVGGDRANIFLIEMIDKLSMDNDIIICSWREDSCRKETMDWLNNNWVYPNLLLMRKSGDTRKDSIVKEEIYNNHIRDNFYIKWVFEDRAQMIDLRRLKLWLFCVECWYGKF